MLLRAVLCLALITASTVPAAAGRTPRARAETAWKATRASPTTVAKRASFWRGSKATTALATPPAEVRRPGLARRILAHRVVDGGYSYNTVRLVGSLVHATQLTLAGIAAGLFTGEPFFMMGGAILNLALMPLLNATAESIRNADRYEVAASDGPKPAE